MNDGGITLKLFHQQILHQITPEQNYSPQEETTKDGRKGLF